MIFSATPFWVGHAVKRNTTALFDDFSWHKRKMRRPESVRRLL